MSSVDLGTAPLSRLFLRYVTPTVAAMLVTGIYVTIDGIFVGHILGQDGLAGMVGDRLGSSEVSDTVPRCAGRWSDAVAAPQHSGPRPNPRRR